MKRDKIALLAKALSTTPAYLMGWKEETPTENLIKVTESEQELLDMFRLIPEDAQKMYLEVLRTSLKNLSKD